MAANIIASLRKNKFSRQEFGGSTAKSVAFFQQVILFSFLIQRYKIRETRYRLGVVFLHIRTFFGGFCAEKQVFFGGSQGGGCGREGVWAAQSAVSDSRIRPAGGV
uniref:Uncharacterized protein n=1 Tax=Neisseria leonii TaxID=2995413 RepID=A0A9X4IEN1_9NEIS|nr:hypothetical protein [Neisseria sp. 51.81]MDD9328377.1 hypothetical protein [Neisseria sp. 51.81]